MARGAGGARDPSTGGARVRDDPDKVLEVFLGFWISRTVMAAVEMDLFEHLHDRAATAAEVQTALGVEGRPARALLDTCTSVGLLERDGDRYRNSSLGDAFLWSGSEYSMRNYVRDERWCWDAWGRLEEALRTNAQTMPADQSGYHQFPADFFLDFLHGHSLA